MSWPPYPVSITKGKKEVKNASISFVISFKLQTYPWQSQPVIVPQLSIRRWFSEPLNKIPYSGATAYVGDNRRWLDGERQPFCFMRLAIKKRGEELFWHRAVANLLKMDNNSPPEPSDLNKQPNYNWSSFNSQERIIQAGILYSSKHLGEFPCFPGVSPLDLASLDRAVLERLPLQRMGEAAKVGKVVVNFWGKVTPKKKDDKSPKKANDLGTPMLRPKIAATAVFRPSENQLKTILILWFTPECRDALIAEICLVLGLSPEGETQTYTTPNGATGETTSYQGELGAITIKTQHVEDLTEKLDVDNPSVSGNNRQQRRVNLLQERIQDINSALPKPEGLSGALVEIKPKAKYVPPESDPKLAWRIAAMQAGYLNQHINPITGDKKDARGQQRIKMAVSDLWRQLGILPIPLIDPEPDKDNIDSNLWLTCFYVIRRTRKTTASNKPSTVALMLRVNPITGLVEMTTPSWFSERGWVSYAVGLGHLLKEKWDYNSGFESSTVDNGQEQSFNDKKREQNLLNQFVTKCLQDCLSKPIEGGNPPRVLFMAEAQNSRRMLTWLRNPDFQAKTIFNELNLDDSEKERLWIARMRTAKDGEVPFGVVKDSPGSRTSGIFQWQDICQHTEDDRGESYIPSLYISMRKGLTTEQGLLKISQSRLDDGGKQAGNPSPLEIAIVHHPGIHATDLASLIHNLRDRWPYFPDYTSLPFPFPFATSARQYAVGVKDRVDLDDIEVD
ncbi:MAG: RNAseH domain-containing protein, partial [Symploca sp. SIO3E6]|nr:RNAseH domain-containing protein [Caldora sp. SIO3E6]